MGAVLRAARLTAGVSLAGMASRTSYSKPYLGQLETGSRTVHDEHIAAYESALGVHLAETDAARMLGSLAPLLQTPLIDESDNSAPPADAEALVIWARAHQWDDVTPAPAAVMGWIARHRDRLRGASTRTYVAAAELADMASAMAWDVEDHSAAREYGVLAARWAHSGGDDALVAATLASLAYQYLDQNRPVEALELTRFAQYAARHSLSPALEAALATRQAWAQLILGEEKAFRRLSVFANDCLSEPDPINTAATPAGRTLRSANRACVIGPRRRVPGPAELHKIVGAGYRDLPPGDSLSTGWAHDSVGRWLPPPTAAPDQIFEMITIARVLLLLDEPEKAADIVITTLPRAKPWAAGRVGSRLCDFRHESARFSALPTIRNAADAIGEMVHA